MLKWRLTEEARADMVDIRAFTKEHWGSTQSARYIREIRERIKLLAQNPRIGIDRSADVGKGIRSFFVGSHAIYYEYDTEMLTIWAILHQAMTPNLHGPRKAE